MGAGWLGLPLAKKLHKEGYEVWASTRQENKPLEKSIAHFILFNTAQPEFSHFPEAQFFDHAVWLIPPGRSEESRAAFVPAIHAFCAWGKEVKGSVILISSTGVYPERAEDFYEDYPLTSFESGHPALLNAEQAIQALSNGLVLRLGGLCGSGRMLLQFVSGKTISSSAQDPVNLIHLEDALSVIMAVLSKPALPYACYNVCAPMHPSKEIYYQSLNKRFGLAMPVFQSIERKDKLVLTERLNEAICIDWLYPNPLEFDY